jgi:hypothetical protein
MWCTQPRALTTLMMMGVIGCTATRFESTWTDATAHVGELQGKRVAVLVSAENEAVTRAGEDAMSRALTAHHVVGIPVYKLASNAEAADQAVLARKLEAEKLDGLVHLRVKTRREVSYAGLAGGPYWGWGYGWAPASYNAPYFIDTVVQVETLVFSLPDNNLLWAGVSNTTDPRKVDSMMNDVATKVTGELKKQGLVVR